MTESPRDMALADAQMLLHPTRYRILDAIRAESINGGRGMHQEQIAEKLGIAKQLVAFHIMDLVQAGFVEGTFYEIRKAIHEKKGRAAKFYRPTPKVTARLANIVHELHWTWGHAVGVHEDSLSAEM